MSSRNHSSRDLVAKALKRSFRKATGGAPDEGFWALYFSTLASDGVYSTLSYPQVWTTPNVAIFSLSIEYNSGMFAVALSVA